MQTSSVKLAIIGSRNAPIFNIAEYVGFTPSAVISGGARGIDTQAAQYARANNIPLIEYLPDYSRYGKGAPIRRNTLIVENCDILLAFWDGKSKGSKFTIDYAKKIGKRVHIIYF